MRGAGTVDKYLQQSPQVQSIHQPRTPVETLPFLDLHSPLQVYCGKLILGDRAGLHLAVQAQHEGDEQQQALPGRAAFFAARASRFAPAAIRAPLKRRRQPVHCRATNHTPIILPVTAAATP